MHGSRTASTPQSRHGGGEGLGGACGSLFASVNKLICSCALCEPSKYAGTPGIFLIVWAIVYGDDEACGALYVWMLAMGILLTVITACSLLNYAFALLSTKCIDEKMISEDGSGKKERHWGCVKSIYNASFCVWSGIVASALLGLLIYGIVIFLPAGFSGGYESDTECYNLAWVGFVFIIIQIVVVAAPLVIVALLSICIVPCVVCCVVKAVVASHDSNDGEDDSATPATLRTIARSASQRIATTIDNNMERVSSRTIGLSELPEAPVAPVESFADRRDETPRGPPPPAGTKICTACKLAIPPTEACLNIGGGRHYHTKCGVCVDCSSDLTTGNPQAALAENGDLVCVLCDKKRRGEICNGCNLALHGKFVQALSGRFHKTCFKCAECDVVLGAGAVACAKGEDDHKPYCMPCHAVKYPRRTSAPGPPPPPGMITPPTASFADGATAARAAPVLLLNGNAALKEHDNPQYRRWFWYIVQFRDHIELRKYASEAAAKAAPDTPLANYSMSIRDLALLEANKNATDTSAKANRFAFDLKGVVDITGRPKERPLKSVDLSFAVSKAKSRAVWLQLFTYAKRYLADRRDEMDGATATAPPLKTYSTGTTMV